MKRILFLIFLLPTFSFAQKDSINSLEFSTAFSYGSENNYGNPGFMLTNEIQYNFYQQLSVSTKVGFFHSMPWFRPSDTYLSYSSLLAGIHLNHTVWFNKNRSFVKTSIGVDYVHSSNLVAQDLNSQSSYYDRAQVETVSKVGYGLSLEGGGRLSNKLSLGLMLQIYSFQIFGDIIVIGPNVRFKL